MDGIDAFHEGFSRSLATRGDETARNGQYRMSINGKRVKNMNKKENAINDRRCSLEWSTKRDIGHRVGEAGFEPATSCSQSRRANQAALLPGPTDARRRLGSAQPARRSRKHCQLWC